MVPPDESPSRSAISQVGRDCGHIVVMIVTVVLKSEDFQATGNAEEFQATDNAEEFRASDGAEEFQASDGAGPGQDLGPTHPPVVAAAAALRVAFGDVGLREEQYFILRSYGP